MFSSFVMAGFDCTHGHNRHGAAINNRRATGHAMRIDEDYQALARLGITTVRDGAPWPEVQSRLDAIDWAPLDTICRAAARHGIHVIHDLCHFGVPDHVDMFGPDFRPRFAEFCYLAA